MWPQTIILARLGAVIFSLSLAGFCQAASLIGQGRSESPSQAKQIALADLASVIHTAVQTRLAAAPTRDQRKPAVRRVMRTGSELPILGASLNVAAQRRDFLATAVLDTATVLPLYDQRLRAIKKKVERLADTRLQTRKRAVLAELLTEVDRYYKHKLVATLLGAPDIGDLAVGEASIKARLRQLDNSLGSLDLAARRIARSMKQPKQARIYVYPPTAHYAREITHFASVIKDQLTTYLPTVRNPARANQIMEGEYEVGKKGMLLTYRLQDANHDTLKTEVVKLSPKVYQGYQTEPEAMDFSDELHRGLVRGLVRVDLQAPGTLSKDLAIAGSVPAARDFRVSLQTDRGQQKLSYVVGERGRLFLKMTRPGYFYIVGHVDKHEKRYSYLLELRQAEGDRRFISFLNVDDIHKWIDLGEFNVVTPVGSEALQVIASSKDLVAMLPPKRLDAKTGLYVTDDNPKRAMRDTRAIVLSAIKKDSEAESQGSVEDRIQYAEAVLEFTTLQPQ